MFSNNNILQVIPRESHQTLDPRVGIIPHVREQLFQLSTRFMVEAAVLIGGPRASSLWGRDGEVVNDPSDMFRKGRFTIHGEKRLQ